MLEAGRGWRAWQHLDRITPPSAPSDRRFKSLHRNRDVLSEYQVTFTAAGRHVILTVRYRKSSQGRLAETYDNKTTAAEVAVCHQSAIAASHPWWQQVCSLKHMTQSEINCAFLRNELIRWLLLWRSASWALISAWFHCLASSWTFRGVRIGGRQRSRRVPPGPVGQAEAFQLLGTLVVDSHQGAVLLR